MRDQQLDVLIAGAGPVGLTLACELARFGAAVRLADGAPERAVQSRATDLHARSLELWDHTGLADAIMAAALPITAAPLYSDGREVARLDFTGIDSPFPAAVSLRQHDLEQILTDHLSTDVEWDAPVTIVAQDADGVTVSAAGETVRARYVVACDGVHSGIRDSLHVPFDGAEFTGRWAVMDAEIDAWPYASSELPVFLDHDGFWAMPLPGGQLRLFFRDDGAGPAPTLADGQAVIDRHVPGGARIVWADNLACFQLHHRVARSFCVGRVLLAGDAAHVMTPVQGQGLNTGIQDVYNLAWKLRLAIDGAPRAVLDSYEAERRPVALASVAATTSTHETNVLERAAADARDRTFAAMLATPAQVLMAVENGHELGVAYDTSPIVGPASSPPAVGVLPGQRIVDAGPLVRADGTITSLRELMRHPGLQVWACVGAAAPEPTITRMRRIADTVRTRVFVIADRPPPTGGHVELFADPNLRVHGGLGAIDDTAYVVRPDGYLGARMDPADPEMIATHLHRLGVHISS